MARDAKAPEGAPVHRWALANDPADAVAWQHAAHAARAAGDGLRAIALYVRAARLHGDLEALARQIGEPLSIAAGQALARVQDGAADEAATLLEPFARLVPPQGSLARALGILRLVQGRDAEAERLHAAAGSGDCGLGVALRGIARHTSDTDFVGTVVIPAHRMEDTIERALDSVAAAARVYREMVRDPRAQIHVCVVDDASPDGTASRVLRWARAHPEQSVALIANNRNQGAGRSRNIGAAAGLGRYIWFLDADDYFFERHVVLTATVLDRTPDAGFVRTGMQFDSIDHEITPAWREASELSYPCNLCVRRVCHDLIGGFPEEAPFHPAVGDDVAYGRALHSLFGGVRIAEKTVHYTMRADNALARQRQTMTSGAKPTEQVTSDPRYVAIEILTQRRIHALNVRKAALLRDGGWTGPPFLTAKGETGGPSPTPAADLSESRDAPRAIDLLAVAKEAIQAGQLDRAVAALTRVAAEDPGRTEAWFELGLLAHRLRLDRLALTAFRAVACLHPGAAAAWCNLGSMLVDADAHAQAVPRLRRALALQPGLTNAQHLLGRANRRLGQDRQGARELERALRLDPTRPDLNADYSETALALGDAPGAAEHARRALRLSPELYGGHAALAGALEALGRPDAAMAAWERAIRCNPGFGGAFTRRALSLLARRWGPPPSPAAAGGPGRRLASTALGRNGRFGNQLLQYGILRLYAARHGLTLEVPPWLGRHLYDHDDPLPGPALPRVAEAEGEVAVTASFLGGRAAVLAEPELADRDVSGYFCGDITPLAPFREEFRALFTPGRHLQPHADALLGRLRDAGRTIVALHLRRGDFGWGRFWIAPVSWYLDWLETVWPTLDRPVLFIATDDPALLREFAAYRPVTARDLAEPIAGAEFFTDFHVLCHADRVAISNSSFSFVATMLNRYAGGFHRPDPTRAGPWFPTIPGHPRS
ncbi:glycosyltransferase [Azospirillum brasilense]|uniref:glycosyltransferase n=1 Tax=Azospirillum brasilense TaxID=192 RepID=UPI001ED9C6C3|nr:glycosyltransferase [Azospirillum brasilense]UKJ75116.1 glycosyltransferase [Azospirillum brasilense]